MPDTLTSAHVVNHTVRLIREHLAALDATALLYDSVVGQLPEQQVEAVAARVVEYLDALSSALPADNPCNVDQFQARSALLAAELAAYDRQTSPVQPRAAGFWSALASHLLAGGWVVPGRRDCGDDPDEVVTSSGAHQLMPQAQLDDIGFTLEAWKPLGNIEATRLLRENGVLRERLRELETLLAQRGERHPRQTT